MNTEDNSRKETKINYGELEKAGWKDLNTNFYHKDGYDLWKWSHWTLQISPKSSSEAPKIIGTPETMEQINRLILRNIISNPLPKSKCDTPHQASTGVEIEEPIGNFILQQSDIKPLASNNGAYYHYPDVCTILNRFKAGASFQAGADSRSEYKKQINELQSALATERQKVTAMAKGLIPKNVLEAGKPTKTLREIKDEVARKYEKANWAELLYWGSSSTGFEYPQAIDEVADIYASQPHTVTPGREWIRVEDVLPEELAQVLIYSENGIQVAEYKLGCFWVGSHAKINITHWMSTPPSPTNK